MSYTIMQFRNLHFLSKNWPNNFGNDFKPPYNLVEIIKKDLDFKEFEGSFEHDGFVNI
jgi:hypothetical protein